MTSPAFALAVQTVPTGGGGHRTVVRVAGEIDATGAPEFLRSILDSPAPLPLVLDLTDVRYLDSAGFAALDELLGRQAVVVVLEPHSPLRTAAAVLGLPCQDSVAAAVSR